MDEKYYSIIWYLISFLGCEPQLAIFLIGNTRL